MIGLDSTRDWAAMLLFAALSGAFGGMAYLALQRIRRHGAVGPGERAPYLVFPFVGAVAAVAILYLFPPHVPTIEVFRDGTRNTTYSYDLVKLIALSVITGSVGGAVLTNLGATVVAVANEYRANTSDNVTRLVSEGASADLHHTAGLVNDVPGFMNSAVASAMPAIREQVENDSANTEERLQSITEHLNMAFQAYALMMKKEAEYTEQRIHTIENFVSHYLEASRKFAKGEDVEFYLGTAKRLQEGNETNALDSSKRDSQDRERELAARITQLETKLSLDAPTNPSDQERGNVNRSEGVGTLESNEATPEKLSEQ